MRNLCQNALEAMEAGRQLGIAARPVRVYVKTSGLGEAEGFLRLCVENEGLGLSADVLWRLNDPPSTYTSKPGRKGGLGLLLSHFVMRKFGGRLELANVATSGVRATLHVPLEPKKGYQS